MKEIERNVGNASRKTGRSLAGNVEKKCAESKLMGMKAKRKGVGEL